MMLLANSENLTPQPPSHLSLTLPYSWEGKGKTFLAGRGRLNSHPLSRRGVGRGVKPLVNAPTVSSNSGRKAAQKMLEVTIWSLLVGNLGWQAVMVSGWLRWQQIVTSQRHQEEEEILTCFESKEDSALVEPLQRKGKVDPPSRPMQISTDPQLVGWEFKIVRASRDVFRKPAVFQQLCEEEAMSGWILLEKLDDRRVRFKRLIALRNVLDTEQLSYDPYRCNYGSSLTPLTLLGAIALVMAIAIPSYFGYTVVSTMLAQSQKNTPPSPSPYEQIPPQNFPPVK